MRKKTSFFKRIFCDKKTKIIIIIFLVLLPIFGGLVDFATGRGVSGTQLAAYEIGSKSGNRYDVGELTDGAIVRQSIIAQFDSIYSVTLWGATWGRDDNVGTLCVSLKDTNGVSLYQWSLDVAGMQNDADITLYANQLIETVRGEQYWIEIENNGSPEGKAATFFAISDDWYPDGNLEINGVQQQGDLYVRIEGASENKSYFAVKMALGCMIAWTIAWIYYCKAFPAYGKRSRR